MASLNRTFLIGNVGNDPDVRYLDRDGNGNAKVASFRLAVTERYKDRNGELKENTEWVNISAWNKSADIVERFVKKGSLLYIEGKLATRKWTDKDGNERFTTEIRAEGIQLLGKKDGATTAPATRQEESPALKALKEEDDPNGDLPF